LPLASLLAYRCLSPALTYYGHNRSTWLEMIRRCEYVCLDECAVARCWLCEIRERENATNSTIPESILGKRRRDEDDEGDRPWKRRYIETPILGKRRRLEEDEGERYWKRRCIRPVKVLGERLPNEMEEQYLKIIHPSWILESWADSDKRVDVWPVMESRDISLDYSFDIWQDVQARDVPFDIRQLFPQFNPQYSLCDVRQMVPEYKPSLENFWCIGPSSLFS